MRSINLLPPKNSGSKNAKNALLFPLLVTIIITALGAEAYYYVTWLDKSQTIDQEIMALEQQTARLKEGDLRDRVNKYNEATAIIEQIKAARPDWKPYLEPIVGSMPKTTKIESMSVGDEGDKMVIQLGFETYEEAVIYIAGLEEEPILHGIFLNSIFKKAIDASSGADAAVQEKALYKVLLEVSLSNGGARP